MHRTVVVDRFLIKLNLKFEFCECHASMQTWSGLLLPPWDQSNHPLLCARLPLADAYISHLSTAFPKVHLIVCHPFCFVTELGNHENV